MANNREKAVKMAERGASAKEIRQATGVSGEGARNIVSRATAAASPAPTPPKPAPIVQTNAGVNPMGAPAAPKPTTLSQTLKIEGVGGLSKGELKSITEESGKSSGQVIQRLDKINENIKEKDLPGIQLNSGAANMLIKQAGPAYGTTFLGMKPAFGAGKIGSALEDMRGTRDTGGYQSTKSGYGEVTPGRAPTLMMGGTAIRPGGRTSVRGFGKQYTMPESLSNLLNPPPPKPDPGPPPPNPNPDPQNNPSPTLQGGGPEIEPGTQGTTATPTDIAGGDLANFANWASGFRSRKSSRSRQGRSSQGLASQRVNPSNVRLNVG